MPEKLARQKNNEQICKKYYLNGNTIEFTCKAIGLSYWTVQKYFKNFTNDLKMKNIEEIDLEFNIVKSQNLIKLDTMQSKIETELEQIEFSIENMDLDEMTLDRFRDSKLKHIDMILKIQASKAVIQNALAPFHNWRQQLDEQVSKINRKQVLLTESQVLELRENTPMHPLLLEYDRHNGNNE